MDSWASSGSIDGAVVTVPDPSPAAPVVDFVVTQPMGVSSMGLPPELMGTIYVPPLAVLKLDIFIARAAYPRSVFVPGTTIVFSLTAS